MKINAQTPFDIQADGKAKFFIRGEWRGPIDLPEFMKYREFLRYKEWEYDTDTGKLRIYLGDGNWSTPFDPPASIGAGGVQSQDIDLTGALATGLSVHPIVGSACVKVGRVVTINVGLWANGGSNVSGPLLTLPAGARPLVSGFLLLGPVGQSTVRKVGVNPDGTVGVGETITSGSTEALFGSFIAA